jgi:hypothetical protein
MALIGSIAISMVANVSKFTKAMQSAAKSVSSFGARATAITNRSLDLMGTVGTEVGKSFLWAAKGVGRFASANSGAIGSVVGLTGRVLNMGVALGKGLVGATLWAAKGVASLVGSMYGAIKTATLYGAVLGGVLFLALKHVSAGAIALAEQTDRAFIDFGEFFPEIIRQANLMATAFGLSRKEFIAAASSFAPIFEGAHYAAGDVGELSLAMTKLAADMSSKVHIPVQEAMDKLKSGLAGNVRPLRDLGISLTEETLKAYAVARGIAKLNTELTDDQKVQARVGYIMERSQKILGNLAATADSGGNAVRGLSGRFENLMDTVGTALNTVIGPAIADLSVGIQALQMAWDASSLAALSATTGVLSGAQQQATEIGLIQKAIGKVADTWQSVGARFSELQSYVTAGIGNMVAVFAELHRAIIAVIDVIPGMKGQASAFFDNWKEDLDKLAGEQWQAFQAKLAAPLPSNIINEAFAAAKKQRADARADLARPGVNVADLKPVPQTPAVVASQKFADYAASGSKEAINATLRSRYGQAMGAKGPAEVTAEAAKKQVVLLGKIAEILDVGRRGGNAAEQGGVALGGLLGLF